MSAIATSADDTPPKPLSAATISGICVVGVRLAIHDADAAADQEPAMTTHQLMRPP
jgi:hypothetical protein